MTRLAALPLTLAALALAACSTPAATPSPTPSPSVAVVESTATFGAVDVCGLMTTNAEIADWTDDLFGQLAEAQLAAEEGRLQGEGMDQLRAWAARAYADAAAFETYMDEVAAGVPDAEVAANVGEVKEAFAASITTIADIASTAENIDDYTARLDAIDSNAFNANDAADAIVAYEDANC